MALADFGQGLLAGIEGVRANTQQQNQLELDRFRNSIYARDITLREDTQNRSNIMNDNKNLVGFAATSGFMDTADVTKFDTGKLEQGLLSSDAKATQVTLAALNSSDVYNPHKDKGFQITGIKQDPTSGNFVLDGVYPDGSPGVITDKGGVDGRETVRTYTSSQLSKLVGDTYTTDIVSKALGPQMLELAGKLDANRYGMQAAQEAMSQAQSLPPKERTLVFQTGVTAAIDNASADQGSVEMARDFREMLAKADTPEEKLDVYKKAAEQFGVAIPDGLEAPIDTVRTDKYMGRPNDFAAFPQKDPGVGASNFSLSNTPTDVNALTINKYDKEISDLQSKSKLSERETLRLEELMNDRETLITDNNTKSLGIVNKDIADFTAKASGAKSEQARAMWGRKLEEAKAKRETLIKTGVRTEAMNSPEYKQFETEIISKIDSMSPEQVVNATKNGEFSVSPQAAQGARLVLQDKGVNSIDDLRKLPKKEHLATLALLSTIATDADQRKAFAVQMDNLLQTGDAGMSSTDLVTADVNQKNAQTNYLNAQTSAQNAATNMLNANTRLRELARGLQGEQRQQLEKAADKGSKLVEDTTNLFFETDSETGEQTLRTPSDAQIRAMGTRLDKFYVETADIVDPVARDVALQTINNSASLVMSAIAETGSSSTVGAWIKSIFLPDANGQTGDFRLQNVVATSFLADGKTPKTLVYRNPEDGGQGGTEISVQEISKINAGLGRILADAGRRNADKITK